MYHSLEAQFEGLGPGEKVAVDPGEHYGNLYRTSLPAMAKIDSTLTPRPTRYMKMYEVQLLVGETSISSTTSIVWSQI